MDKMYKEAVVRDAIVKIIGSSIQSISVCKIEKLEFPIYFQYIKEIQAFCVLCRTVSLLDVRNNVRHNDYDIKNFEKTKRETL